MVSLAENGAARKGQSEEIQAREKYVAVKALGICYTRQKAQTWENQKTNYMNHLAGSD